MTTTELDGLYDRLVTRAAALEAFDPTSGTILVRAAPYGQEAEVAPRVWESFNRGAFGAVVAAPHRVKLWLGHSTAGGTPVGHGVEVEDKRDGVWVRAKVNRNTAAGHDAYELADDGTLDEVSVEFRARPDWFTATRRPDGVHVRHTTAQLLGVALVPHGAYGDGARVLEVRALDLDGGDLAAEEAARELALAHLRGLTS